MTYNKITFVHQSSELYGSDRSMLSVVLGAQKLYPQAEICVVLPSYGPLVDELKHHNVDVEFEKLGVLRKSKPIETIKAVFAAIKPPLRLFAEDSQHGLLYVNTAVIFNYIMWSRFFRGTSIVHVREIPTGIGRQLITAILRLSGAKIIFNSNATKACFSRVPSDSTAVIHNGVDGPKGVVSLATPIRDLEQLRVLMIGRLNDWKGQDVLLEALSRTDGRFHLKIAGDVYAGNEHIRQELEEIAKSVENDRITIEFVGFQKDTQNLYSWAHVVVVPSKKPEPFGRVAIEAFSFGKPVVASACGGLLEIVTDGHDGLLVEPCNSVSLSQALDKIFSEKALYSRLSVTARETFQANFTSHIYVSKVLEQLQLWQRNA